MSDAVGLHALTIFRHYGNMGNSLSRLPPGTLPPGTAAPQVVLAAEPVSESDLSLVSSWFI